MNKSGQRVSAILPVVGVFAAIAVFLVGARTILRTRLGSDALILVIICAFMWGEIWLLRLLFKGAWRMITDRENRKFNGLQGALGAILGILMCGTMLWFSIKALINLVLTF